MTTKYQILLAVLIVGLFHACKKDPPADEGVGETFTEIKFGGIVKADDNGQIIGSDDTSGDWSWDKVIPSAVDTIFGSLGPKQYCETVPIGKILAYPNPCTDFLGVKIQESDLAHQLQIAIYDKDANFLQHLKVNDPILSEFVLNIAGLPSDTLRMYYQLQMEDCLLEGFGDILRSE